MIGGQIIAAVPRRRIYREAIKGGELVITYQERPRKAPTSREPKREGPVHEATTYFPSQDVRRSVDFSIMRAWVEAEYAHPGDGRAIAARVETAVRKAREGALRYTLGRYYYRVPPEIRALMAEAPGDGLKRLLGQWEKGTGFQRGVAGLSERQAHAYWLKLRGWSTLLIARELTAPALRDYSREHWVSAQTVYHLIFQARAKLQRAFGLEVIEEIEDDE